MLMNSKKKPEFRRQDSHKKARLSPSWRRPRGLQSKMRLKKKGYPVSPSTGYKSSKSERGKVRGLVPVKVERIEDLKGIDSKTHCVEFSGRIGKKRKLELLKAALEMKLTIINVRQPEELLKKIEGELSAKKKEKEEKAKKKEKAKEELKKKAEEKEKKEKEEAQDDEEKKLKEKKELDKVLTTKE
ncbi:hypothetical protein D6764_03510 [Candidatus Woesearchaeota archaeon]|nr:MAG: hypothetical protein D6764_03510 [Candidatus Woesearchaeota archaeon]